MEKTGMDIPLDTLFVAILTLIGFTTLSGAICSFVWTLGFARRAISVDGLVIGLKKDEGEFTHFLPIVEFEASDHTKHVFISDRPNWWSYRVGQTVRVLYDPDRSQDAVISILLWVMP